jgi:hypothetical protein
VIHQSVLFPKHNYQLKANLAGRTIEQMGETQVKVQVKAQTGKEQKGRRVMRNSLLKAKQKLSMAPQLFESVSSLRFLIST